MKVIGITQARVGSTRLPGKVLLLIKGKPLLKYHLERVTQSKMVHKWVVATTQESGVESIISIANSCHVSCFQGNLDNVLNRFYEAVKDELADYIVRVTSDCPLIDPKLIDAVVEFAIENDLRYCKTSDNYPDGFDVEVFKFSELKEANESASLMSDKEHVTPFIRRKVAELGSRTEFDYPVNYNKVRLTVDEANDFETISLLIDKLGSNRTWSEYTEYVINNQEFFSNQGIIRNEGYLKSIEKDK